MGIAVIGGGPAGLMAAEILAKAGKHVCLFEQKPSPGRKFLMAGRGGLNLTHSENLSDFLSRYRERENVLTPLIEAFTPADLRAWCETLGEKTFVGSSGRVFPKAMKASPLLRAWIRRLTSLGVEIRLQHRWRGWNETGDLVFYTPHGQITHQADAVILALGGASWPSLGSDGAWQDFIGIQVTRFKPANCGFAVKWSDHVKARAGQPLKAVALTHKDKTIPGEMIITENGIEGGAVYALSAEIRDDISANGSAAVTVDLRPSMTSEALEKKLSATRGRQSFSTYLQKTVSLSPLQISLLRERNADLPSASVSELARTIKSLPLELTAPFPIERAISSAGGIPFEQLDENMMVCSRPGLFVAGEMLDWEAPTGGYLLQATFATAKAAAEGLLRWQK